jgi:hypothetical protein
MGPVAVPGSDEGQHGRAQLLGRPKAALAQALALEDAEEELHLVHPGRVFGRVMEDEAVAVAGVERTPSAFGAVEVDVEIRGPRPSGSEPPPGP